MKWLNANKGMLILRHPVSGQVIKIMPNQTIPFELEAAKAHALGLTSLEETNQNPITIEQPTVKAPDLEQKKEKAKIIVPDQKQKETIQNKTKINAKKDEAAAMADKIKKEILAANGDSEIKPVFPEKKEEKTNKYKKTKKYQKKQKKD